MENAIKAMYMGAGLIIGVLVLGVLLYMFRSGARVGETYEFQKSTEQLQAFNAQFENYEHESEQMNSAAYGYSFISKGNTPSDVVSCANLAFDVNHKHDYDLQNGVQVKVEIGTEEYFIYPFAVQRKNRFIKGLSFNSVRNTDALGGEISESDYYNFYEFLKEYNNVRIVNVSSTNYNSVSETIYQYYFDVDDNGIEYNEVTGKVNSITFRMYETKEYNNDTYWFDNV